MVDLEDRPAFFTSIQARRGTHNTAVATDRDSTAAFIAGLHRRHRQRSGRQLRPHWFCLCAWGLSGEAVHACAECIHVRHDPLDPHHCARHDHTAIRVASIRLRLRCRCGLRIAALGLEGYASGQTAPFVGCALQMPYGSPDHTASSLWLRPRSVSPASTAETERASKAFFL